MSEEVGSNDPVNRFVVENADGVAGPGMERPLQTEYPTATEVTANEQQPAVSASADLSRRLPPSGGPDNL